MTIRIAETITGHTVRVVPTSGKAKIYSLVRADGYIIHSVRNSQATPALHALIGKNYQDVASRVRTEQGHRCLSCGRIKPLETDHIVKRSSGRSDRRENLRALCVECHGRRHLHPKEPLPLDPEVLESVRRHGLVWTDVGWKEEDRHEL